MTDINEIDNLRKASLINNEIKKGESDEKSMKSRRKNNNFSLYNKKSSIGSDKKIVNTRKEEICRQKLYAREAARAPKTIRIPVCTKPCTPTKRNYIPRNCMTKEEWMNLLSKPNRKCSPHYQEFKEKVLKEMPTRINELAQPSRQRMIATLHDRGTILPAPLVDRLITVLEAESCLTPEQAEKLFRAKRKKKKRKGKKKKEKKSEEPIPANQQLQFDKDATICQYLMAESFVKSILQWKCTIPKEDFQDIAEVVFGRLKQLFNRNAVDNDERGSQQMRLLADIIAAWIAGILFEVAQSKEDELKKECEERKKTLDDNIEDDDSIIDMQIISDEDSTKRDDGDDVVDDVDDDDDDDDDVVDDVDDDDDVVDDADDDVKNNVDDEDDDDDDNDDDSEANDDDSESDDDDSDDETNNNNDFAHDDYDDDNDNENGDGDRHNHGIVVDDVEDKKDEDEFHEVENEENNDEQNDGKETLQPLIDDTIDEKMKTEDKIQNEVIEEYNLSSVSRGITSTICGKNKWYDWQQCMGSEPFRMGLHKNLVNQNDDSLTILDDHDMIKNDETNYPRDSIVAREINPNL
ncbi:hypothetical protein PV326_003875 [Microctonus aethiopoides]|nr:hypothetical protein PV326_003875 [Microctonus aethiopoides]